jgi:nicotinamide-nucleotide amidase
MDNYLRALAERLVAAAVDRKIMVATAESCTGGMVAAAITAIPGASAMFDRSFVTYTNEAKTEMVGVPSDLIASEGAVSEAVACRMAEGAIARSHADIAVAITGIAGPSGGTLEKPVGTVWIATCVRGAAGSAIIYRFDGERDDVRLSACKEALNSVLNTQN